MNSLYPNYDTPSSIARHGGIAVPEDTFDDDVNQKRCLSLFNKFRSPLYSVGYANRVELERWKYDRIKKLLTHAYRHVSMYREVYESRRVSPSDFEKLADIEIFPILTKNLIASFPKKDRIASSRNYRTYEARTSGSTGRTFSVFYDRTNALRYSINSYRQFDELVRTGLDWTRPLYVVHHIRGWFSSLQGKLPTFVLSHIESPTEFMKHLEMLRPQVLFTMPGYLREFCLSGLSLRDSPLEVIVTNSESSTREERIELGYKLGVPVFDEYSSEELGIMASECAHRKYHCNEDSTHMEFVPADDPGYLRIVGTDMWNFASPFIRYDHNDLCSAPSEATCSCGRTSRSFDRLFGRMDSNFLRRDGSMVNSAALTNTCDSHFNDSQSGVEEFRFVQRKDGGLELLYQAPLDKLTSDTKLGFSKAISSLFGYAVDVNFVRLHRLPALNSYKRRKVISELTE